MRQHKSLPLGPSDGASPTNTNQIPASLSSNPSHMAHVSPAEQARPAVVSQQSIPLPQFDMSLLQGITPEQLMTIGHLFQSGALSLPPNPPSHISHTTPPIAPTVAYQRPSKSASDPSHPASDVPNHKDDGMLEELDLYEDGEVKEDQVARVILPPSQSKANGLVPHERPSPASMQAATARRQSPAEVNRPRLSHPVRSPFEHANHSPTKEEESAKFLLQLHQAGYTFDQVLAEVGNEHLLRGLYLKLGLLSLQPVSANDEHNKAVQAPRQPSQIIAPEVNEVQSAAVAVTKRPAPTKPTATVDRSVYLAKLQAAKNKRQSTIPNAVSTSHPAVTTSKPDEMAVVAATPTASDLAVATPFLESSRPMSTPAKLSAKNDLIRQRLEALKAVQARKAQLVAQSIDDRIVTETFKSSPASSTAGFLLGQAQEVAPQVADLAVHAIAAQPDVSAATQIQAQTARVDHKPPPRTFSGLPGLYTLNNLTSLNGRPLQGIAGPADTQSLHALPATAILRSPHRVTSPSTSSTTPISTLERPASGMNGALISQASFDDAEQATSFSKEADVDLRSSSASASKESEHPHIGPVNRDIVHAATTASLTSLPFTSRPSSTVPSTDLKRKLDELEIAKQKLAEAQKRRKLGRSTGKSTPIEPVARISTPDTRRASDAAEPVSSNPGSEVVPGFSTSAAALTQDPQAQISRPDAVNVSSDDEMQDDDDLDDLYDPPDAEHFAAQIGSTSDQRQAHEDVIMNAAWDAVSLSSDDIYEVDTEAEAERVPQDPGLVPVVSPHLRNPVDALDEAAPPPPVSEPALHDEGPREVPRELQGIEQEPCPIDFDESAREPTLYTTWESPLVRFKDYRYHPLYMETVRGGHKSLTYSHRIDPMNQLCPFEAHGGQCQDASCSYQHWQDMVLSELDNDLLRVMGAEHIPAGSPQEQQRWREGLGAVIKQLRATNLGKDASVIAARITEYRRDFLNDESRVLRTLN